MALINAFELQRGPENYLPRLLLRYIPAGITEVESVELQALAKLPCGETPYEVEVAFTQRWAELPIIGEQQIVTWGVSVAAIHWDEALNSNFIETHRRDWGEGLRTIWPGEQDLDERLDDFLECIFSIQDALDLVMKPLSKRNLSDG
jgi:hypothetical protein